MIHHAIHFFPCMLCVILCNIAIPNPALGNTSSHPIEYAYPDQSIWTIQSDGEGGVANPLLHFVEALFSARQFAWSAKAYPANRMFERLQEGKSNFSILVKAARLGTSCIFSEKPVTYSELRIYRNAGASSISQMEDLKGKKVITIRGYSYGKVGNYLKEKSHGIVTFAAPRHESAFEMLRHGRADYLLDYSGPSEEVLSDQPIPGVSHDVLTRLDVFLVLSKNYPDAQNTMNTLEHIAASIDVTQWGLNRP